MWKSRFTEYILCACIYSTTQHNTLWQSPCDYTIRQNRCTCTLCTCKMHHVSLWYMKNTCCWVSQLSYKCTYTMISTPFLTFVMRCALFRSLTRTQILAYFVLSGHHLRSYQRLDCTARIILYMCMYEYCVPATRVNKDEAAASNHLTSAMLP